MSRIRSRLGDVVILMGGMLASVLLVGCVSSTYTRVYESLPAKSKDDAENLPILTQNPLRRYRVIADSQFANVSEAGVRKWAASVGADAVLVATSTSVTATSPLRGIPSTAAGRLSRRRLRSIWPAFKNGFN